MSGQSQAPSIYSLLDIFELLFGLFFLPLSFSRYAMSSAYRIVYSPVFILLRFEDLIGRSLMNRLNKVGLRTI